MSNLILHTKSRISGKNADVHVYSDRLEWKLEGRSAAYNITALVLAFCTVAISLIFMRPAFGTQATESIPASKITSVQTKKDGIYTVVNVITAGNSIPFRTTHDKAAQIRDALTALAS